jgi:K+/H+ antiporter YhaU regulatory subunit KhtT
MHPGHGRRVSAAVDIVGAPHPDDRIESGDHLTLIGRREGVRGAIEYCTG